MGVVFIDGTECEFLYLSSTGKLACGAGEFFCAPPRLGFNDRGNSTQCVRSIPNALPISGNITF
ncbi:hypothetical protein Caka_0579 [Coraliomargarita akajimensis DSM 45221]|uniref:Uncharacterized protein n=1 Tax=Coraliomargarita akajimensis (strain DSM 45221 / IAM 15411 / JCM 23193 / KCTC 12865 / 04OKA010-24) TaxID=583355 RepID=D5ENU5_CORAD|nr:hypothetical protein Caka_0579 [Coraliomargarita akajimensis DSM 45221]